MQGDKSQVIAFFSQFIENETGIRYSQENAYQLESRLEAIAKQLGYPGVFALYEAAKAGLPSLSRQHLIDTATNNETFFFRDPHIFEAFAQHMVPAAIKQLAPAQKLRVWSAAASTGQEVFSLVMSHLEKAPTQWPHINVEFLATDVSVSVLKKAESGVYTQLEVQRGLSEERLGRYFKPCVSESLSGLNCWIVNPEVRRAVQFKQLNLLSFFEDVGAFHIIFIRNMLIYQSIENKKKILSRVTQKLLPGGFLVLGAAESLIGITEEFTSVKHGETAIFYQKPF